ncbi:hypothetical protein CDD80_2472 [Ophiocordyceps camponoti-rufipedis]|uniref:Beta-lactamase-related domain-containing protein n=1 Tax=Ophiocordyceps camponoti-rufipedis TaxID=2004952 RepID=A0A2C5Z5N5_9HYPO|nr:hypothetical protein CDD80_2472 [Ophiocordyceps camponoti-rufipedis]
MAKASGTCDARFDRVRQLLEENVASGWELGASIAVNLDGRLVVDLWAGWTDESRTKPWQQDTIVNVFSTTKTVTSLAALMLVDRGLIDVDDAVCKYWPEFGANGKESVLVRHLLSHSSGVSGWDDPVSIEHLYDFDAATARLARQSPWWPPGTASGYHSMTMGFLVGELMRRVTDTNLKDFVASEIAGPLDADFQIGAAEKDWPRVTDMVPPDKPVEFPPADGPDSLLHRTMLNPNPDPTCANTAGWRRAELGAGNGHGNARSLVRIFSTVTLGEVDGKRLLSDKTLDLLGREQVNGVDLVLAMPVRFGIGFGMGPSATYPFIPSGRVYFWGGWGGSYVIMDLDRRVTISYTMNKMGDELGCNSRGYAYGKAIYEALADTGNSHI